MINAGQNSWYGEELHGLYIVLRFTLEMLNGANNQKDKIRITCDNLSGVLDSFHTVLKTKNTKRFRAILRAIKKHCIVVKK